MKKRVTEIEIVKYVAERGNYKGQEGEYVVLTLDNRGKNWIAQVNKNKDTLTITRPQNIVDMWIGWAKEVAAGKKIEETVPKDFLEIDNVFRVHVPLDGKYYRLYRKQVVDKTTGKVQHKKGDIYMMDDGKTPQIYDGLDVLAVKYEDDDTGEMCWLQTPESIVRDMINRGYYKPVVANVVSINADEDADKPVEAGSDEPPVEEHKPTAEELQAELERLQAKAATV